METFLRSDLAMEWSGVDAGAGVRVQRARVGGCEIVRVHIATEAAAARLQKPCGRYVTVEGGDLCRLDEGALDEMRRVLSVELRDLAERACGSRVSRGFSVLVIGLGNREITPDAVGPETVRRLAVTRHLCDTDRALSPTAGLCRISAVAPGVTAQTGIEAAELVRGAVRAVSPDLVIAVDALAARDVRHLAAAVQISDVGVRPGSGLGGGGRTLSRESVGVPVIAIGVSTVVDSAALMADALRRAGIESPDAAVRQALTAGKGYFVSPREIDLQVAVAATLLSGALERAFSVDGYQYPP